MVVKVFINKDNKIPAKKKRNKGKIALPLETQNQSMDVPKALHFFQYRKMNRPSVLLKFSFAFSF
jgi:hypothetical protein